MGNCKRSEGIKWEVGMKFEDLAKENFKRCKKIEINEVRGEKKGTFRAKG